LKKAIKRTKNCVFFIVFFGSTLGEWGQKTIFIDCWVGKKKERESLDKIGKKVKKIKKQAYIWQV
jgi:hypothetical protein